MKYLDRCLIEMPFHYALCINRKQYRKELKRLGIKDAPNFLCSPHANATTHYLESADGKKAPVIIVCLGETAGRELIPVYGLLVHEAVHIFQFVKEYLGENYSGREFEAYAIQWITQQLMWAFEEASK